MESKINEIEINGVKYIEKSTVAIEQAKELDGLKYVLIRADRAGVFVGYLEKEEGSTVVLRESRRLWYWSGAASLSQLAVDGVSNPSDCKIPVTVKKQKILGVIEIIDVTKKAQKSIEGVKEWKA